MKEWHVREESELIVKSGIQERQVAPCEAGSVAGRSSVEVGKCGALRGLAGDWKKLSLCV